MSKKSSESWAFFSEYGIRSPLKTSCERKCVVRTSFALQHRVAPPRKAYSLT
nr:MAG TPA: hypothetical protein [Caudoviricetes sp.]